METYLPRINLVALKKLLDAKIGHNKRVDLLNRKVDIILFLQLAMVLDLTPTELADAVIPRGKNE